MVLKVKRYLVVYDAQGQSEVWFQYANGTVRLSALGVGDIEDSDTPTVDLRSDKTSDEA